MFTTQTSTTAKPTRTPAPPRDNSPPPASQSRAPMQPAPSLQTIKYGRTAQTPAEAMRARIAAVRAFISANPQVIAIITLVLFAIAATVVVRTLLRPENKPITAPYAWYMDLNTGKLFVDDADRASPIPAPSGPTPDGKNAGARAVVYTCGSCDNEADRFVAYLERTPDSGDRSPEAALVTTVTGTHWAPLDSDEARALMASFNGRCAGGMAPDACLPRPR